MIALTGLLVACEGAEAALGIPPDTCSTQAVDEGESPLMEPGGDCIGCHASEEGPNYLFAGSVMAGLHDDTNCAGVAGVTVRITDADDQQIELVSNATGNFFSRMSASAIAFPYTAEVTRNGVTVPMLSARTANETNCAVCHTAQGNNGAPGRILAP